MTIAISAGSDSGLKSSGVARVGSKVASALLALVIGVAAVSGFVATGAPAKAQAIANMGPELANLLRAMAAIKAGMAGAASLAIGWRLRSPIPPLRLAGYLVACAAMTAGVGLIWTLAHVGSGALMLHAGLLAAILLFWRDPDVAMRIAALVAARRAVIASRA